MREKHVLSGDIEGGLYIFHEGCVLCAGVVTAQIGVAGVPLPHIENVWFKLISADCELLDAVAFY